MLKGETCTSEIYLAFLSKKCLNTTNAAESNKFGQRRNLEELVLI
jgi:hypothetical protein